jgi:hypothetical protein
VAASSQPMSIIIVGVGSADFSGTLCGPFAGIRILPCFFQSLSRMLVQEHAQQTPCTYRYLSILVCATCAVLICRHAGAGQRRQAADRRGQDGRARHRAVRRVSRLLFVAPNCAILGSCAVPRTYHRWCSCCSVRSVECGGAIYHPWACSANRFELLF